jgi:opacity protein-like surface antigen
LLPIVGLTILARMASAQEPLFNQLNLDKLQLTSLGVSIGRILVSQAEQTGVYGVSADYGEFAPSWHIVFGVSYWESRFRDAVVQQFVDSLNKNLAGAGDAHVVPSKISLYDVTFSAETRYTPTYSGEIKPYVGIGVAAHVVNADGDLINGTFVERSLDNIAPGLFVTAGLSLRIVKHVGVEGGVRADLLSGFRSTQIRAGGTYYFGHVRGTRTSGDGK